MTRASSSDSSALSNIVVAGAQEDDSASEGVSASTPPTSMTDSVRSAKAAPDALETVEEESGRRPKRARSGVSTYNIKKLSEAQQGEFSVGSRNVSGLTGHTLVGDEDEFAAMASKVDKDVESEDDAITVSPQRRSPRKLQHRPSVKERVKNAAGKVGSVLGKRSREAFKAGKRTLGVKQEQSSPQQKKILKELDTGTKGVLDEMDLSDDEFAAPPPRPAKRVKLDRNVLQDTKQTVPTAPPLKISSGKLSKKWQKAGLYAGQPADLDPTQAGNRKKLQKKRPGSSSSEAALSETNDTQATKLTFMKLPMFSYLDKTRDFVIPFDIYAPSVRKGDEKPKDWHKINRNRLVGEAKDFWEKAEKLPNSACVCSKPAAGEQGQGCGDDCLNRVMQYECNDDNCNLLASQCSNRAFAELAARVKKGGAFDIGVEVLRTPNRGFGVRSCRTFAPGQIIMEYTGEIISEGECQRRMREEYKDKQCYYLMELERGLIIDGTKGSMARFINHSCAPNCEVRMVKVSGTPRMAVFAGEDGIMTGDELTYDYNFDNFGATKQLCYCGAPTCRGTLSKRLNAVEQKRLAKEENERRLKAAEEAKKVAEKERKQQQVKHERGANWRGWVAVDDPETKERLKREKREREEAEKNSSRARRLASRRESLPAPAAAAKRKEATMEKSETKRRKTMYGVGATKAVEEAAVEEEQTPVPKMTSRKTHVRTASASSKFTEEFNRPLTGKSTSTVVQETETETISVSSTREVRKETRLLDEEAATTAGADDVPQKDGAATDAAADKTEAVREKSSLLRTATKGKEALKTVGQALKGGLLGFDRGSKTASTGSSFGSGPGGAKLRQSTLSFAKVNHS